jgi:hypothetical protein
MLLSEPEPSVMVLYDTRTRKIPEEIEMHMSPKESRDLNSSINSEDVAGCAGAVNPSGAERSGAERSGAVRCGAVQYDRCTQ